MILSRYFDKADYGTYKQVMYVYNTLLTVFTLGLPKAYSYFLPRVNPQEAKDLINKITRLFFLLGGVFSILLFLGASLIPQKSGFGNCLTLFFTSSVFDVTYNGVRRNTLYL